MDPMEISFGAPLAICAADGAKPRRFDMDAYTGVPMNLVGFYHPVVVDMKGIQGMEKSRPILHAHDMQQRVGHTDSISVQGGVLKASGVISGSGDVAKEICAEADSGFPWQASIGAKVLNKEFVPEGSSATVNGKSYDGPINIARKISLGEISLVALGADDNTSARIAAGKAEGVNVDFVKWLEAKGFQHDSLNDAQKTSLKAAWEADVKASADKKPSGEDSPNGAGSAEDIAQYRKDRAAEAKRVAAIDQICAAHKGLTFEREVDGKPVKLDIAATAIEEGWTRDATELQIIRSARAPEKTIEGPFINTGAGMDSTPKLLAAAGALSGGISDKYATKDLNAQEKDVLSHKKFRGIGLHAIMAAFALSQGIHLYAGAINDDAIRQVLRADQMLQIQADGGGGGAGGYSTMSLSGITENILNKAMLQAYEAFDSVVDEFCFQTDTNDFKSYGRYRMTGSGQMAPVGPGGELKSISLQDEAYKNQLGTIGGIIVIHRQILLNDDMGALTQLPTIIARLAALGRERAAFLALLTNSGSFFGSGNKNYTSGAGSALSITSMTTSEQTFIQQTDVNGDPIMLNPDRILVPPALKVTGENLFNSAQIIASSFGSTSSRVVEPSDNPHKGKYRTIYSPFLGASGGIKSAAGAALGSDTGWYHLTDPMGGFAPVQIGYLRGQRTPIIERGEANFNTLGMAMRAIFDFGVALLDFRSAVLNAGV